MPLLFRCPACGRELEAPDEAAGSPGACRFCGATITAPTGPGQPAGLVAPGGPTSYGGERLDLPTGRLDAGEVLSEGWDLLKVHWPIILAANLVMGVITAAIILPIEWAFLVVMLKHAPNLFTLQREMAKYQWGFLPILILLQGVLMPLSSGPTYLAHQIVHRGNADFGVIFRGFRQIKALFLFGAGIQLLMMLPTVVLLPFQKTVPDVPSPQMVIVGALAYAFMIFVYISLGFARMEIIDRGVDGITAFKASWEFTKGHRWMILATGITLMLAYMLGIVACFVGLFATMGFFPLGEVLIYRHLRGLHGAPDA